MTMCDFVIPKAMFACKVFLKKWPHWGSCECTEWWTPNTILYMEEKSREENRFWWFSAGWPISDRNQKVSAAQHQERKEWGDCKHLYFRGGRWRFLLLNRKLRSSLQLWCAKSSKESTADGPIARSASDCTAQSSHQSQRDVGWQLTVLRASVWHQDWRNVILSRRFSVVGELGMSACRKMGLYLRRYIHLFWPKRSWCPKFDFCFQKSHKQTLFTFFLVHSLPFSEWNSWPIYFPYL